MAVAVYRLPTSSTEKWIAVAVTRSALIVAFDDLPLHLGDHHRGSGVCEHQSGDLAANRDKFGGCAAF
jgi:hypothetical protein